MGPVLSACLRSEIHGQLAKEEQSAHYASVPLSKSLFQMHKETHFRSSEDEHDNTNSSPSTHTSCQDHFFKRSRPMHSCEHLHIRCRSMDASDRALREGLDGTARSSVIVALSVARGPRASETRGRWQRALEAPRQGAAPPLPRNLFLWSTMTCLSGRSVVSRPRLAVDCCAAAARRLLFESSRLRLLYAWYALASRTRHAIRASSFRLAAAACQVVMMTTENLGARTAARAGRMATTTTECEWDPPCAKSSLRETRTR